MKHSPEPWEFEALGDGEYIVHSADGYLIASGGKGQDEDYALSDDDMQRAVACVNACRGIPTEELESYTKIGDDHGLADLFAQKAGYMLIDPNDSANWNTQET